MKNSMRSYRCVAALLGVLGWSSSSLFAQFKIDEKIVGPANAGGVYGVGPRGVHVAYTATKGSRLAVSFDGVEGPLFDELFSPTGQSYYAPPQMSVMPVSAGGGNASTSAAVIFSTDGAHYAYIGRQGNEYVVMHDGKEVGRGPREMLALNYGPLTLSPGGKRVFWHEMQMASSSGSWRCVIDGKPGPWSGHQALAPVFSQDDSRFAYTAVSVADSQKLTLIVDGKDAGYVGLNPVFTADGKLLLTQALPTSKVAVLADGKVVATGISIEKVVPGPVGRRYAALVRTKVVNSEGVAVLYLDGKEVAGTEGAKSISFSPDGKRYALTCTNPAARSAFMIVDGKKGNEYQSVSDKPVWTSDSSKVLYTATSAGRSFAIADGQEFAVHSLQSQDGEYFVTSGKGGRYAFASGDGMNRNFIVVVDGQQVLPAGFFPSAGSFTFSPDGSRYAYQVGQIGNGTVTGLIVDGKAVEGYMPTEFTKKEAMSIRARASVFSPDGKTLAHLGRTADRAKSGIYVNGKLVHPTESWVMFPTFTPDSRHFVWVSRELTPGQPGIKYGVYVDGQLAMRLDDNPFMAILGGFEMGADGVFTGLAVVGDAVKRFRITPPADTNVEKMIANAERAQAKAIADAADAAAKAEAEAAAAKAKSEMEKAAATAKGKADAETAQAKRKADYDAAVAAKAKARQDAIDAKTKARQDAAAAKAK